MTYDPNRIHQLLSPDHRDAEVGPYLRRRDLSAARLDFLDQTRAIQIPVAIRALWLMTLVNQGDAEKVWPTKANYASEGSNTHEHGSQWLPTVWPIEEIEVDGEWKTRRLPIPPGFGSTSLDLMVLPELVTPSLDPVPSTSARETYNSPRIHDREDEVLDTVDSRPGWEWGHTEVVTLQRSGKSFHASKSDESSPIYLHRDVQHAIQTQDVEELARVYDELVSGSQTDVTRQPLPKPSLWNRLTGRE